MTKFATVKITVEKSQPVTVARELRLELLPSAESGPRRTAQKAQYHHDQVGSMIAKSNGDPALRTVVTSTK